MNEIRFITTHFNFTHCELVKQTYFDWHRTLPTYVRDRLIVVEAVMEGDEPEIPGSLVRYGKRDRNVLWQKEALIKWIVDQLDPVEWPFVVFLDHDMVFNRQDWYIRAQELMHHHLVAVQCMYYIGHEDAQRNLTTGMYAATYRPDGCNPGGPWMTTTQFLQEVGIYLYNIVGGGDVTWFRGVTPYWQYSDKFRDESFSEDTQYGKHKTEWIAKSRDYIERRKLRYAYALPNIMVRHLYHGDLKNRYYRERGDILLKCEYNPETDVVYNESTGLLEWTDKADSELKRQVSDYFLRRTDTFSRYSYG